jgi:hypothetical protein
LIEVAFLDKRSIEDELSGEHAVLACEALALPGVEEGAGVVAMREALRRYLGPKHS